MNFAINDMLKALQHLTGSMAGPKLNGSNTLDYSYITPTIIALGEFSETKVDDLLQLTQGDPVIMWNLGGKALPQTVKLAFNMQVIDVPWKTPCQYTKAPLLETVFSLCQSIKSWYDLHEKHLAIIHCPAGHPSTGIIVACLLKYIGAFDHAAHAYDFYCSKRLKGDPAHSLAPSYRNLFTNVDKTVDQDGYASIDSKYLKTITIAGLPVEDIPCVEVADIHGIIYSSHVGWHANSSCTWNAEYGDGYYKVSTNIIGDFSIICRFGGHLSANKDRSTLIFKYQHSTAFLLEEVLELKYVDVDINPQYADSLDIEIFTVHLMFENDPSLIARANVGKQKQQLLQLPKRGLEAFKAGLSEISTLHPVTAEAEKCLKLLESGYEKHFVGISLQLSNNETTASVRLIDLIQRRVHELNGPDVELQQEQNLTSIATTQSEIIDDSNWEVIDVKCPVCKDESSSKADQVFPCNGCHRVYHTFCVGLRRIPFGCKTEKDQLIREKYIKRHLGEWKCNICTKLKNLNVDGSNELGEISKPSNNQATNDSVETRLPTSPARRSKQDQIAILITALSSDGIGMEELIRMNEEQQREAIRATMMKKYPELMGDSSQEVKGSLDLATAMQGILSHTDFQSHKLLSAKVVPQSHQSIFTNGSKNVEDHTSVDDESKEEDQTSITRANMMEVIKRRGMKGENNLFSVSQSSTSSLGNSATNRSMHTGVLGETPTVVGNFGMNVTAGTDIGSIAFPGYAPYLALSSVGQGTYPGPSKLTSNTELNPLSEVSSGESSGAPSSVLVKDIPEYNKYFRMIKAGIPKNVIAEKIVADGTLSSIDMASSFLSLNPEEPLPSDFLAKINVLVTLASHPKYEKFYKMLKVGISKEIVKAKMEQEGVNPTILDKDPSERVPLNEMIPAQLLPSQLTMTKLEEDGNMAFIPLSEHPKYCKFFKMLKMGISHEAVKSKMVQENVDPTILDKNPTELVSREENDSEEMVPISEHPKYSKYFKMLKVGLPLEAVQAKMSQEGTDPSMIMKSASEKIPLHEVTGTKKVPLKDHPKYEKFFKMLKVGLPPPAVKNKMQMEGVDPSMLDRDPEELVPLEDQAKESKMVKLCEHPKYEKFFKMLKVGLPPPAVKNKMQMEGVDPSMLDRDPEELVPLEDEASDDGPKVAASEHPLYGKYFKMLKVGLPADVVKSKMALEKLDPTILDKDPSELIPLNNSAASTSKGATKAPAKPVQRKKKLHWKAINEVNENSLWADTNDIQFDLDEEEFNKLFVETIEKSEKKPVQQEKKELKKTKVVLIDMKRAQNGSIALARIKYSPEQLRTKIMNMDDDGITTDQLKSMAEYLPTADEVSALQAYRGDKEAIGIAEKYMMEMMKLSSATKCIQCMIYKQQFRGRYQECRSKIIKIQNACDDVKMSIRLKKVLKAILRIGNQLNDGVEQKGFTVDSLLKLHTAKANDKKTTVLQYVVTLIFRNDEDSLKFPEDLKHVSEASRFTFETIITEKNTLRQEFETNLKIVEDIRSKDSDSDTDSMLDFLTKADALCSELEKSFDKAKEKFSGVLVYFGEDPNMNPQEFFSTLSRFIQEFITVRENVDRSRRAEIKRQQQQQQQLQQQQQQQLQQQASQNDNSGKSITAKTSRRHTSLVTTTPTTANVPEKSDSIPKQQAVTVSKPDTPTKRETEEKPKPATDRASLLQDIMKKPNSRRKSAIL